MSTINLMVAEMTDPNPKISPSHPQKESNHRHLDNEDPISFQELELSLPKEKGFLSPYLYFYQNFWCPSTVLQNVVSLQTHFQAQDTDILLVTKPKSGTTWLKALTFAILNRETCPPSSTSSSSHPLLTTNPHVLVPFLEYSFSKSHLLDLSKLSPPRILSTHMPYHSLPQSIHNSGCRLVYLCRNPLDTLVSFWKYSRLVLKETNKLGSDDAEASSELEMYLDSFCKGIDSYGPYWGHVLGYWQQSLDKPNKVMFMKYEDIKKDEASEMKRLAEFLGVPFTKEEVENGVIEEVNKLCSFGNLKELEVNKSGKYINNVGNKAFFRKGEVGDWVNHLTPSMVDRLEKVMQDKFGGTNFSFKVYT